MQYPHEASTGTPGPVFGRRQKDLENKTKSNLDHLESSKGRPIVRTKPVSGLRVGQDKGEV